MSCTSPVRVGLYVLVPCGKCIPCRVKKKMLWASRIQLEALSHPSSCFVTLTYDENYIPDGRTLHPPHVTDWLKRIRFAMEPLRLRYFAVGEYGDQTQRPHYHVAMFGYPYCSRITSDFGRGGSCCPQCDRLSKTWGMGRIDSRPLDEKSAKYIAGYVVKKMTAKDDERLQGRHPEFARMSLKPGLGALFAPTIAKGIRDGFMEYEMDDVPATLRAGSSHIPLGKYVRGKIREEFGWPKETPDHVIQEFGEKMRLLHEYASENNLVAKEVLVSLNGDKARRTEFFENLAKRKRTL